MVEGIFIGKPPQVLLLDSVVTESKIKFGWLKGVILLVLGDLGGPSLVAALMRLSEKLHVFLKVGGGVGVLVLLDPIKGCDDW